MKKVLLVLLVLFFMCTDVGAVATDLTGTVPTISEGEHGTITYIYTSDNVAVGVPEIFKITTQEYRGEITEILFFSSSTAWSVFLSRVDGATTPTSDTYLKWSETSNVLGSPSLPAPRTFYNGDGRGDNYKYTYFTVSPVTVATSTWVLMITYKAMS